MNTEPRRQSDMCVVCGKRPKFIERGFQHQFCGKTCAKRVQQFNNDKALCRLHGCPVAGHAALAGFCSESHAQAAVRSRQVIGCSQCNDRPPVTGNICAICDSQSRSRTEARLEEIDSHGAAFKYFVSKFQDVWKPANSGLKVGKLFKVHNSQATRDRYETNCKKLESTGHKLPQILRTYHSSQCICNLGYLDSQVCDSPSCGICNILKSSFHSFAFGEPHNNGRHGKGIYSYSNPNDADKHSTSCTSSPYRVMIACDVTITQGGKSLFSLLGRPTSISDEHGVFVNNPDAIIASHIILYTK